MFQQVQKFSVVQYRLTSNTYCKDCFLNLTRDTCSTFYFFAEYIGGNIVVLKLPSISCCFQKTYQVEDCYCIRNKIETGSMLH